MSPVLIASLNRWLGTQIRIDTTDDAVWIGELKQVTESGDLLLLQQQGGEEGETVESWFYGAAIVRVRPTIESDFDEDEDDNEDAPAIDLEALFSPPRGRR